MSVKTNELPQAAEMAESDSFVVTTSQGTKRLSLSLLRHYLNFVQINLLYNWYFVGGGTDGKFPVNQNGVTTAATNGFVIDRWSCTESGFSVNPDSVTIPANSYFYQKNNFSEFIGQIMTMSVLLLDGTLLSGMGVVKTGSVTNFYWQNGIRLYLDLASNGIGTVGIKVTATTKIVAAKLEVGNCQTLAKRWADGRYRVISIPRYNEELSKCQSYLFGFNTGAPYEQIGLGTAFSSKLVIIHMYLPVSMRTLPALSYSGNFHLVGGPERTVSNISVLGWNGSNLISLSVTPTEDVTPGDAYILRANNDVTAKLFLTAEL